MSSAQRFAFFAAPPTGPTGLGTFINDTWTIAFGTERVTV